MTASPCSRAGAFRASTAAWLLALVLSGCLGATPNVAPVPVATYTRTTGAVEGIVTDDEIVPLIGANVTIAGVGSTFTDAGGWFAFSNLEPGRYNVTAEAILHETMSQMVDVTSESLVKVRFALPPVPIDTKWIDYNVQGADLVFGTPQGGTGQEEGYDRKTFRISVVGKTPSGEPAIATRVDMYLQALTPTTLDLDLYVFNGTGKSLGQSATGSASERFGYDKPLKAQTVTAVVHFWLGANAQFRLHTNVTYATGVAASLITYQEVKK